MKPFMPLFVLLALCVTAVFAVAILGRAQTRRKDARAAQRRLTEAENALNFIEQAADLYRDIDSPLASEVRRGIRSYWAGLPISQPSTNTPKGTISE